MIPSQPRVFLTVLKCRCLWGLADGQYVQQCVVALNRHSFIYEQASTLTLLNIRARGIHTSAGYLQNVLGGVPIQWTLERLLRKVLHHRLKIGAQLSKINLVSPVVCACMHVSSATNTFLYSKSDTSVLKYLLV